MLYPTITSPFFVPTVVTPNYLQHPPCACLVSNVNATGIIPLPPLSRHGAPARTDFFKAPNDRQRGGGGFSPTIRPNPTLRRAMGDVARKLFVEGPSPARMPRSATVVTSIRSLYTPPRRLPPPPIGLSRSQHRTARRTTPQWTRTRCGIRGRSVQAGAELLPKSTTRSVRPLHCATY
jgi:hypothetical protein